MFGPSVDHTCYSHFSHWKQTPKTLSSALRGLAWSWAELCSSAETNLAQLSTTATKVFFTTVRYNLDSS